MARGKFKGVSQQRERDIKSAIHDFHSGKEPSIRSVALTYHLPFSTLRDRLQGAQLRSKAHIEQQVLTPEEEKAIVRFAEKLDDLGHPLKLGMIQSFAESLLLPLSRRRTLGKNWFPRFLARNPSLTAKFSQRLDRQRANANNPIILKDFFWKVGCSATPLPHSS